MEGMLFCLQYQSGTPTKVIDYIKAGPLVDPASLISSDPLYVCQCNSSANALANVAISCSDTVIRKYVYLNVAALYLQVDSNSITPGVVLIFENTTDAGIVFVSVLRTSTGCENYTIDVPASYGDPTPSSFDRYFATERSLGTSFQNTFQLSVQVLPCPIGFNVENKQSPSCVCEPLLTSYGAGCNISDETLQRSGNMWIGYVTNGSTAATLGIIDQCPYDYCKNESRVPVADFDSQCAYNRQMLLCGQCKDGLSMTFGNSVCHVYVSKNMQEQLSGVHYTTVCITQQSV